MAATFRTLKQLRDELAIRLGFASQNGLVNAALLNSFLRTANEQVWAQCSWLHNRRGAELTLTATSQFLGYPDGAEPGFLTCVSARISGQWIPLSAGIDPEHRLLNIQAGYPLRYEQNAEDAGVAKIEFWPVAQQDTPIRLEYDARPGAFTKDTDRPAVFDELVFLHALVNAKLHYRQPDGQVYSGQLETLLGEYKARHFGRRVFCAHARMPDPYSIPPG